MEVSMKFKFTYRSTRLILLIMLIVGLICMFVAARVGEPGDTVRTVLIWIGVAMYLISIVVMFIGFRCPACGAHFFKNALFMHKCPVCGFEFNDFELGKKVPLPEDWQPVQDSGEKLHERK